VYHLYVVQHERRDQLAGHLAQRGIQTAVNYPTALPFLPAYRRLGHGPADFPVAYRHQSRILSLPMFPEMSAEQMGAVAAALRTFAADGA
jgi:dTDP-4-amino-4,6-dideoxygalactose transaminase